MTVEVWAEKILRGGVFVCSTSLSARHNQSARARPRALPAGLGVQLHEPLCIMPEQSSAKSPLWLKRLGSRIRQARRVRGFTQTDIAKPNLTKSFISLLESGRTYPSVSTLVTLASRLQTSLALLLLEAPQLPRETVLNMLELARASAPANAAKTDRLLTAADALAEDADDLRAELLLTRGDIAHIQGRPRDAERTFGDALTWSRKRHLPAIEPRVL